jgi:hypothetical protein
VPAQFHRAFLASKYDADVPLHAQRSSVDNFLPEPETVWVSASVDETTDDDV